MRMRKRPDRGGSRGTAPRPLPGAFPSRRAGHGSRTFPGGGRSTGATGSISGGANVDFGQGQQVPRFPHIAGDRDEARRAQPVLPGIAVAARRAAALAAVHPAAPAPPDRRRPARRPGPRARPAARCRGQYFRLHGVDRPIFCFLRCLGCGGDSGGDGNDGGSDRLHGQLAVRVGPGTISRNGRKRPVQNENIPARAGRLGRARGDGNETNQNFGV